jgi:hypothetical protein
LAPRSHLLLAAGTQEGMSGMGLGLDGVWGTNASTRNVLFASRQHVDRIQMLFVEERGKTERQVCVCVVA